MKDIDFDELDRAVNSLMGGVPKDQPKTASDEDEETVLTISPSLDDERSLFTDSLSASDQAPKSHEPMPIARDDRPAETSPDARKPVVPAPPAFATRRGGRFMDVVHPSSDMTKSQETPPRVSRHGFTLERTKTETSSPLVVVEDSAEQTEVPKKVAEAPLLLTQSVKAGALPEPDTTASTAQQKHDWPDPLDHMSADESTATPDGAALSSMMQTELSDMAPQIQQETSENVILTIPEPPQSISQSQDTSLQTPFLSGAKVEKRPLGGSPSTQDRPTSDSDTDDEAEAQLPPDPLATDVPLPEELSSNLMAIEADPHMAESFSTPVAPHLQTSIQANVSPTKSDNGPSSITRQYAESPSSTAEDSGAIYDTATYHQPLTHPAKQSNGWLWVLGIVAIILLGVAGGAFLYFSGKI